MQIIQSIRDKGAAIVIGVIALSLIGFLLMDARGSGKGIFGGGSRSTTVAKVNGESLDIKDYDKVVKQLELQQGGNPNPSQLNQIRSGAWEQMVAESLIDEETGKLGLTFSPSEITRILFSEDAPQVLKQNFTDPKSGIYDVQKVQDWWKGIKKLKDNVEKERKQKEDIEAQIIDPMKLQTLYTKYNSYFTAATYYPTWMKQKDSADNNSFASISYTFIPFSVINDSTIKVTDAEVESYVEKNKAKFKQESGRMVSYYTFSSSPSAKDSFDTKTVLDSLKGKFAADSNAKLFVTRNSSAIPFADMYVPKKQMQMPMHDTIAALGKNQVFGPYLDADAQNKKANYVLAKMLDTKIVPDSIKCRHILIGTANPQTGEPLTPDSIAKAKIDSVENAIKGGASFEALEALYTTDQKAHELKGVMTFDIKTIQSEGFAKEFGEFLQNEKGETKKVVKTVYGYHYIEILDKINPGPAFKVAYLAKEIAASEETINDASQKAVKLSGTYHDAKSLDDYAAKNGLKKIVMPNASKESDFTLGALEDGRKIIRWAFKAKQGDVSEPITIGDQNIVAVLDKILKDGTPDVATARPLVERSIKQQKIAEEILKKIGASPTLESAAAAYTGIQVQTAGADSSITFAAQAIPNIGQEPKLIGACFNKDNLNKTLKPITGTTGVFVVKVNSVSPKDPAALTKAIETATQTTIQNLSGQFRGWYTALRKLATVKDYRIENDLSY